MKKVLILMIILSLILINTSGDEKNNPNISSKLFNAIIDRNNEEVKYLIENGADVDLKDNNGSIALSEASFRGYFEIVKYLIEKGADVNLKDEYGSTALFYACLFSENLELVKYLIEKGADVNIKNNNGLTAFMYACDRGGSYSLEVVKYLIEEQRVNVNIKDNKGNTALDLAKRSKYTDIVDLLKKVGAKRGREIKQKIR